MSVRDIAIAAALVGCCQGATLAEIPGFPCYRTVEETYAAAEQIVADHPTLATWTDIGDSWEKSQGLGGYDLFALRLTNAAISTPKPKLVVTCTIHAREYPPAELCTRFAERLVEEYGRHPDVTWILDRHEIHLIPIGNPDGRKLAETGDLWRKNTNQNHCGPTSEFRGADLNRNFEFEWGCCGASGEEECSDYYRGPSPASEPETQAIQSYLRAQFPDQRGEALNDPAPASATGIYLDVHSAGKLVLWPWAFGPVPPNVSGLRTLGRKLAFFNGHLPKQFANLYLAEGTAIDFAYGDLGVAAYLFELGVLFFQDCATLEEEILPGNLEALLYAARVARLPYLTPAGPDAIEVEALPGFVDAGTPVTLSAIVTDERYSTLNGTEPAQNVASALAYAGSTPWDLGGGQPLAMSPLDGALDSPVESVEVAIDTTGMAAGPHLLYVRGQDAEGNVGPLGASFLWIRGGPEGGVAGSVTELGSGQPLAATVEVDHLGVGATSGAADGGFALSLPAGAWVLRANAPYHREQTLPVVVTDGGVSNVAFQLELIDADGDGVADLLDCERDDAALWAAPTALDSLRLTKAAADNLLWDPPLSPGSLVAPSYDLLRSGDPRTFATALCLESGEADRTATDGDLPGPGELLAYLVRAANACGSTLGPDSGGVERTGAACP